MPLSRSRRRAARLVAVLAILFAVVLMHAAGDHDLNVPVAPTAAAAPLPAGAASSVAGSVGVASGRLDRGASTPATDGPDRHGAAGECLALLAAAIALPLLTSAQVRRTGAVVGARAAASSCPHQVAGTLARGNPTDLDALRVSRT